MLKSIKVNEITIHKGYACEECPGGTSRFIEIEHSNSNLNYTYTTIMICQDCGHPAIHRLD